MSNPQAPRCFAAQAIFCRPGSQVESFVRQFAHAPGLPFAEVLDDRLVQQRCRRIGPGEGYVIWLKPARSGWLSVDLYEQLPNLLMLRLTCIRMAGRNTRSRRIDFVTTLHNARVYPRRAVADLYRQRWHGNSNLRHLKTIMKMEVLHCQTEDGVTKELGMFALAYKLVRLVMLEAARRQQGPSERYSLIDALRWLRTAAPGTPLPDFNVKPRRPDRFEPRVVKRSPREHSRMTQLRDQLRNNLLDQPLAA